MDEKIQVNLILEILGRPAEHIKEALNTVVIKMSSEKGVKLLDKKYHEPKPVENTDLFTSFAEVSLELDSLANYFGIVFAYLPAHIEIVKPEKITLNNFGLNELGNRLLQRLHDYDAIAKKIVKDRDIILKKLYEVAPHLFKEKPAVVKEEEKAKDAKEKVKGKKTKTKKQKKKK